MWAVKLIPEAKEDLKKLDGSLMKQVLAGIRKVSENPLPQSEGGYGKPLGHSSGTDLTGFFKIKYRGIGIRVVYTIVRKDQVMNIVVISAREESACYRYAERRKEKYEHRIFQDDF